LARFEHLKTRIAEGRRASTLLRNAPTATYKSGALHPSSQRGIIPRFAPSPLRIFHRGFPVRKLFHALVLFGAIAALVATGGTSTAPALQKDKDKKADEVGKIVVSQAKDGWRFKVVDDEGKAIAVGTVGYEKKEDCLKAVEFVKTTMAKAKVTEVAPPKKEKDKKDKDK
jgi:uncharacterized protein YegP (UPF0339 family)